MLRTKTIRGRRIARAVLLSLVPTAVAVGLGQTQSHVTTQIESAGTPEVTGSAEAGKAIFKGAGNCLSCHRVGSMGAVLGPNLSDIGAQDPPDKLKQELLSPSTTVEPKNRLYEIVTIDGKSVKGKLLNQGPSSLQMLASDGRLVAFQRSQIRESHLVDPPQMPSYQGKLTSTQIDDLVAYLALLRAPRN